MPTTSIRVMQRMGAVLLALTLMVGSFPLGLVNPATAVADSTWVVTSLADDGTHGTLRYAIDNSSDGDTISFAEGLHGTIYLDSVLGELKILHPITIEGPGAGQLRIDGGNEVRVLNISTGETSGIQSPEDLLQMEPSQPPAATVVISGLTLQNGLVFSDEETLDAVGGNVLIVGSSVALEDCVIQRGEAIGGGGIAVAASRLWLERCSIRDNSVGGLSYDVGFAGGGGGLLTLLALVVANDCVFEGNVARDDEERVGLGGGITTLVSLCIFTRCDIRNNAAGNGDDAMGGLGGGVFALANLVLAMQDCTVSDNVAGNEAQGGMGGGIFVTQSYLTILARSLLSNNIAGSEHTFFAAGGGFCAAQGDFSIDIPDLTSEGATLGIDPEALPSVPPILVNCTLSGNRASAAQMPAQPERPLPFPEMSFGGGAAAIGGSTIALIFSTVTDNTAGLGGGVSTFALAVGDAEVQPAAPSTSLLLLRNSIVAGNSHIAANGGDDIFGQVESYLGNLIGDSAGWVYVPNAQTPGECSDLIDVDPLLGPLADNGGPTKTHVLLPGSPAVDAACNGTVATGYPGLDEFLTSLDYHLLEPGALPLAGEEVGVKVDQRSEPRPVDGDGDGEARCDIGAFEAAPDINLPGVVGDTASAATTRVGECTQLRVRVANEGDAVLLIDRVEIAGRSAGDFSVVGDPTGQTVLPGRSTDVILRFCPSSQGGKTATLIIYSNDPFEDPLQITLTGTGLQAKRDDTPEPASMSMSYLLIDPVQVLPGQQVLISANVCNSGEEKGSLSANLMVNGSVEQSQSIAVSGGSCKEVLFTVAKAVPGTYQVAINGMTGQFSVLAPRTVQGTVASQQHTGLGTGGLIAIAAIMVVLVLALVYVFRRQ